MPVETSAPSAYTTRLLPVEEWDRLLPFPFATNGLPNPDLALIVVTENAAGEIVGIWEAATSVMLDGLWVRPDQRGTVVAGRLLSEMRAVLRRYDIQTAFTLISDSQVMVLTHKAGFTRAPGNLWLLQSPPATVESED